MEVKLNTEITSIPRTHDVAAKPGTPPAPGQDVSFDNSQALNQQLAQTPDVRSEAVKRSREMVASGHYPPDYVIETLSKLLALKLNSNEE